MDELIAQSNSLTQSRYEFTKIEKRIIYKIIKQIRAEYITGSIQNDLFNDMVVTLTYKDLQEVSENWSLVHKSMKMLKHRFYEFDNDERWLLVGIINKAKYYKGKGSWEVTVDKEMVEQFVELARNYTEYSLTVAMSLRSEHTQRLYEYCSQFRSSGGFRMSVKNMKEKMKLVEKYSRYASFKKFVVDVAHRELKALYEENQCDLYFEYSEEKKGRSVEYLRFKVISKDTAETKMSLEDYLYNVRTELARIFETDKMPKNKDFINKLMGELTLNPDKLVHCYNKIVYVKQKIDKDERQRYLRFIINEEYLSNGQ